MYLQESDVGAENDPETFSQAINCKESDLWFEAMKEEMNSMRSNEVWDLVELPNGAKAIGYKWVYKTKKDSLGNIERYKLGSLLKDSIKKRRNRLHEDLFSCIKERFTSHNLGFGCTFQS